MRDVAQLEQEFAAWARAATAVAAGFGRAALRLAVEAALPEAGRREVLLPDFTCAQVAGAVRAAGGVPRFYPVTRELRAPLEEFRRRLAAGVAAAVVTHYFGEVLPETEELVAAGRAAGVLVIEDCALALGATDDRGRPAGSQGDLAAYSFSKSEWCYGGGMATAAAPALGARLAERAQARLARADGLALRYGLLRRIDALANRPRWAAVADSAGRWLERAVFPGGAGYFDAGRDDAALSPRAARRARKILASLEARTARRQRLRDQLTAALASAPALLHPAEARRRMAGAYVLLQAPAEKAGDWRERAAREGVTLRLAWPAYQPPLMEPPSDEIRWLAGRLLILELDPHLAPNELLRIAATLRKLAEMEKGKRLSLAT